MLRYLWYVSIYFLCLTCCCVLQFFIYYSGGWVNCNTRNKFQKIYYVYIPKYIFIFNYPIFKTCFKFLIFAVLCFTYISEYSLTLIDIANSFGDMNIFVIIFFLEALCSESVRNISPKRLNFHIIIFDIHMYLSSNNQRNMIYSYF